MKLAEALHERADLQKRIAQLGDRLMANAKVQEGDEPSEDPAVLLAELKTDTERLAALIAAINLTNSKTVKNGETVTEMIARKDMLALRISVYRKFLEEASAKVDRYSNKEIRVQSTVSVRDCQCELDALSKELREADVTIQGLNWTTDLLE